MNLEVVPGTYSAGSNYRLPGETVQLAQCRSAIARSLGRDFLITSNFRERPLPPAKKLMPRAKILPRSLASNVALIVSLARECCYFAHTSHRADGPRARACGSLISHLTGFNRDR